MNVRPHSDFLPQENENHSSRFCVAHAPGCRPVSPGGPLNHLNRCQSEGLRKILPLPGGEGELATDFFEKLESPKLLAINDCFLRALGWASIKFISYLALFFLIPLVSPLHAQNIITNVMSPVVSYQYYDSPGDSTNSMVVSSVVSYQFYDVPGENTNSVIVSPVVSYQYFDSPSAGSVQFIYSPSVSYNYQYVTSLVPVALHGRVTGTEGSPLVGAGVLLYYGASQTTLATTDANGDYQFPTAANGGNYSLQATATGYQGQMRGLTLNPGTAEQDFQLLATPPLPNLLLVSRSSTVDYTVGDIMGSVLRIYNGATFVPMDANNLPSPNLMTIVMTHGWVQATPDASITNTPFDRWPTNMAVQLQTQGITPATANIVAWDWRYAASASSLLDVGTPEDRTLDQGVALGEALQHYLGAAYSRPLHFLGHSLGTLVNASAINYLHGENVVTGYASPTPWKTNSIQVTLFDQAQLADLLAGASPVCQSALPFNFTWADNYKSLVGLGDFANAVNVNLQKGFLTAVATTLSPFQIADDSHGYPMDWYGLSITEPLDENNSLGFMRSYEYAPLLFPPTDVPKGSYFQQAPLSSDELALEPVPSSLPLGLLPDIVLQATTDTIQYTAGASVQFVDTAQNYASSFFNYASGVAAQRGQAVVSGLDSSASLGIVLTTGVLLPDALVKNNLPKPLGIPNDSSTSNLPPMVWLPIQFPTNAVAMIFDFMAAGDPEDDVLICGVGTNDLFSLEAKYIPTNQITGSRLIDVSQWAGTTNELFFGFMGGTSTNATLQIQNIRFYSFQLPLLQAQISDGNLALSWPLSGQNFSLQTTTDLADPNSWITMTNIPAIVNLQNFVTNSIVGNQGFYRLVQSQ